MWQTQAQARAEDSRLASERQLTSRGSALVRFEYLRWNEKRTPDEKRVKTLKDIFKREGCLPMKIGNHIPVTIDQQLLDAALEDAQQKRRWQTNTLPNSYSIINSQGGYPELEFPGGLEYLHGCQRIQAGREYLTPSEKWWIVDLYLSNISYELRTFLVEEYTNEEKPCDGEIYRKIRRYHSLPTAVDCMVSSATCHSLEMRWWARLKGRRVDYLKGMLRISQLASAFDALARITGLCDSGMKITTLHKVRGMRCHDWIVNYLGNIEKTWGGFFGGISQWQQRVDKVDVKVLELRAPGASTVDAEYLQGRILGGVVFKNFSPQERVIIWNNIWVFKGIIPSLSTFFLDIIFLEKCIDGVKRLVAVSPDETVSSALDHSYIKEQGSQWIQTSETTFDFEKGSLETCKKLGILGLVAFVMRLHQYLPKDPVKKNRKTTPRAKADRGVLQQLAALAEILGFDSLEIRALSPGPTPIIRGAREFVPFLVTTGPGVIIKERCGIPHEDNFKDDMKYLFLHDLCEDRAESGEGITSFFVLKSWFTSFFEPPRWSRPVVTAESPNSPLPSAPNQHVGGDKDMADAGPQSPGKQEPEVTQVRQRTDLSERMRETIELVQHGMSGHAVEANRRLETKMETESAFNQLTAENEAVTQNQAVKGADTITIYFIEGNVKQGDMMESMNTCESIQELHVDDGDPNSLVEQAVGEYLQKGKRTCNRYQRRLAADRCYATATQPENKNTLFLIPCKSQARVWELEAQAVHVEQQEAETLREQVLQRDLAGAENDHEQQRVELEEKAIKDQKEGKLAKQQIQSEEDGDTDLLDKESDNCTKSLILDKQIVIYFKQRLGNSCDTSKPAEEWEWENLASVKVPVGDPHHQVRKKTNAFWATDHLTPHNRLLKSLQDKDCYQAAEDDRHHTLYMLPIRPLPAWEHPPRRTRGTRDRKIDRSQKVPFLPLEVPQLRVPKLNAKVRDQVESSEMTHIDKKSRGPNGPDMEPKVFGWSDIKDTSPQIRKKERQKKVIKARGHQNEDSSAVLTVSQPRLEAPLDLPTEPAAPAAQMLTSDPEGIYS